MVNKKDPAHEADADDADHDGCPGVVGCWWSAGSGQCTVITARCQCFPTANPLVAMGDDLMSGRRLAAAAGLLVVLVAAVCCTRNAEAQPAPAVQWVWFNEGDPAREAPAGTRYFRTVFKIDRPVEKVVDEGTLDITADDPFTVWVNGAEVGKGDDSRKVFCFDVQKHLVHGDNVVAVEARNAAGPAGLLVRLAYVPNGQSRLALGSDGSWKASKTAKEGWQKVDFNDADWSAVKVLGAYGQAGPWKDVRFPGGGDDRFTVPEGFRVEMVVPPEPKAPALDPRLPFSLINMTFDAGGRLLVAQERG